MLSILSLILPLHGALNVCIDCFALKINDFFCKTYKKMFNLSQTQREYFFIVKPGLRVEQNQSNLNKIKNIKNNGKSIKIDYRNFSPYGCSFRVDVLCWWDRS